MITVQEIDGWRRKPEDEHLEFKEAKNRFDFELLIKYCCALANEGGGKIVLGITDKLPRRVVGTLAFEDVQRTKAGVGERLRLRVQAHEVQHPDGRVLVFEVPPRPLGTPIEYKGGYWMRLGEELVGMTTHQLQRILAEAVLDYSATIVAGATLADLDPKAVKRFRELWIDKLRRMGTSMHSAAVRLKKLPDAQLLADAELLVDQGLTVAALVLMGKAESLARLLPQSEVVFEYRNTKASGPASFRQEFREGFLNYYDKLWELVNRWNTKQVFQDGFLVLEILSYNERVVREAILNAVSHRDYTHAGSIFLRLQPEEIQIDSPGGFPVGVNEATIYKSQNPRNRRIAEAFARCGFVERSGQGVNLMIELSIQEGKALPSYAETDAYHVRLRLDGKVRDTHFPFFLNQVQKEMRLEFSTEDLLVLDYVRKGKAVPKALDEQLKDMLALGLVIGYSRGRGRKYMLSLKFEYELREPLDEIPPSVLDREAAKTRIFSTIQISVAKGVSRSEIADLLPSLSDGQIKGFLRELKKEGLIEARGIKKGSRWFVKPKTKKE